MKPMIEVNSETSPETRIPEKHHIARAKLKILNLF